MCCFSGPVRVVTSTSIFARGLANGRQALVYEMSMAADQELAMVLPIPVPIGVADDAVEFVSLAGYRDFFADLASAFPAEMPRAKGGALAFGMAPQAARLVVHDVGDFEASFVPKAVDFARLDPRFRLEPSVTAALTRERHFGFAVFKLKASAVRPSLWKRMFGGGSEHAPPTTTGPRRFHPMAFTFPRLEPKRLFFPTVHVHDGEVHPMARFDHSLYFQGDGFGTTWTVSPEVAKKSVDCDRAKGLVDPNAPLRRRMMFGDHANEDVWIDAAA
jgi:hypothetical protein